MRTISRAVVTLIFLVGCVGCDQVSKAIVRASIPAGQTYTYLGGAFRIDHAENPGAFLSVGASLPSSIRELVFTLAVGAVVVVLQLWAILTPRMTMCRRLCVSAIAAGGTGNLLDRLLHHGTVTDFLYLGIGPLHTGIFNVADVVLMLGLVGLLLERPLGGTLCHSRRTGT
jgi:signal peptidase II